MKAFGSQKGNDTVVDLNGTMPGFSNNQNSQQQHGEEQY